MKKLVCLLFLLILPIECGANDYLMTYLYGGTSTTYTNNLEKTRGLLDLVSPSYFNLDAGGRLVEFQIDRGFITSMREKGVKVTPFLSNHWDKPSGNAALDNRVSLAYQLFDCIQRYDMDGINVDIQNVNEKYRDKYTDLVRILRELMPDKIITVAAAANPNNWQTGWHGSYDYEALARFSDYIFIMAYDESFYGGNPGPVASGPWVEKSIQYALEHAPASKIVLGVPFFGRYWKNGQSVGGNGIASRDVEYLINNYSSSVTYHKSLESAEVALHIGENDILPKLWGGKTLTAGDYTIWYDDLEAMEYKTALCERYGLKGMGSWALGQEIPEMWPLLKTAQTPQPTPEVTPPGEAPPELPPTVIDDLTRFRDVDGHWAENYIIKAYDKRWMRGIGDMFEPERPMTRAEAAVVLVNVCNLDRVPNEGFADTAGHWAADYIATAKEFGLVSGMGDNMFYPDNLLTRGEMCQLLDRLLNVPETVDYTESIFTDVSRADWAYDAVTRLSRNNLVLGFPDFTFRPQDHIRRSEMAVILERISGYNLRSPMTQEDQYEKNPSDLILDTH